MELLLWLSMGRPGNKLLWKTDLPNGDHCMATCGAMSCPQALLARVLSPLHQRPPCYYQMKVAKSDQWLSAYCKLALMPVLNLSPPPLCLSYRWENRLREGPASAGEAVWLDLLCCFPMPSLAQASSHRAWKPSAAWQKVGWGAEWNFSSRQWRPSRHEGWGSPMDLVYISNSTW